MSFYTRDGLLYYVEYFPLYGKWEVWHGNHMVHMVWDQTYEKSWLHP